MKNKAEAMTKSDINIRPSFNKVVKTFECDQCQHPQKTESGLKLNIEKTPKITIPQADGHMDQVTAEC